MQRIFMFVQVISMFIYVVHILTKLGKLFLIMTRTHFWFKIFKATVYVYVGLFKIGQLGQSWTGLLIMCLKIHIVT